MKKKEKVQIVTKPYLRGAFSGKDAWETILKKFFGMLGILVLFALGGILLGLGGFWGTLIPSLTLLTVVAVYQLGKGQVHGANDVNLGEILYEQQQQGRTVDPEDRSRCFHPLKGFFIAFMAALPFVIITLVYAFMAKKDTYTLGVLPSWTQGLLMQGDYAAELGYYSAETAVTLQDVLKMIVRLMCMPVISVANQLGADAVLFAERFLCPLLMLLPALFFGFGYTQGPAIRTKVHTGIRIGVNKKLRKQRRERKNRKANLQQSQEKEAKKADKKRSAAPERLI